MSAAEPSLNATIKSKQPLANNVTMFELALIDGAKLPTCAPGSHIALTTPSGANRWYSVYKQAEDGCSYFIAVKREEDGRGGSKSLIDESSVGDAIVISEPECEFELGDAPAYLLIAGGIGITPIYSMWQALQAQGHPNVKLVYLAHSREDAPLLAELEASPKAADITFHFTSEAGERFDFFDLLLTPGQEHLYCCGPKSLMTDVKDMTGHWSASRVHFEDFKPVEAVRRDDKPFAVNLVGSDKIVQVSEKETLLDALRREGVRVMSSCESGTCGSCRIPYVAGEVDHRDLVLEDEEHGRYIMACVSRAQGDAITIDVGAINS